MEIIIWYIGENYRSPFHVVDKLNTSSLEKEKRRTYQVRELPVGELLCLKLQKTQSDSRVYVDNVVLTLDGTCHTLPCHRWLSDEEPQLVLRDGKGIKQSDLH